MYKNCRCLRILPWYLYFKSNNEFNTKQGSITKNVEVSNPSQKKIFFSQAIFVDLQYDESKCFTYFFILFESCMIFFLRIFGLTLYSSCIIIRQRQKLLEALIPYILIIVFTMQSREEQSVRKQSFCVDYARGALLPFTLFSSAEPTKNAKDILSV